MLDIILVNPKIPQNTGSIARTCAATGVQLHIAGEPAFEISDRTVKRAGLDYWPYVKLFRHANLQSYLTARKPTRSWYLSKHADTLYWDVTFEQGDALIFGDEVNGLGQEILAANRDHTLKIPMWCENVRSLNLSNAVSVVLYEALRQINCRDSLRRTDHEGR